MAAIAQKASSLLSNTVAFGTSKLRTAGSFFGKINQQVQFYPPPSGPQFSQGMQELGQAVGRLGKTSPAEWTVDGLKQGARVVVEVAGFFTLGEMLGRGQIIGYKY